MQEHFEAEAALSIIERERVTAVGAVPAQLAMMIACPNIDHYDLRSLRFIRCTGSPLLASGGESSHGETPRPARPERSLALNPLDFRDGKRTAGRPDP